MSLVDVYSLNHQIKYILIIQINKYNIRSVVASHHVIYACYKGYIQYIVPRHV
jgi:hypothetical protein